MTLTLTARRFVSGSVQASSNAAASLGCLRQQKVLSRQLRHGLSCDIETHSTSENKSVSTIRLLRPCPRTTVLSMGIYAATLPRICLGPGTELTEEVILSLIRLGTWMLNERLTD